MQQLHSISQRFVSFFFLLLVLNASFFAVFDLKADSYLLKNQVENAHNQDNANNTEKDIPTYSETVSFHAVIDAGLQCEFQKLILVAPQSIFFYCFKYQDEVIKTVFQSVALLPYFQNLFEIAIQINAP